MAKFLVKKMYRKLKVRTGWFSTAFDENAIQVDVWVRTLDWERKFIKTLFGKMGGDEFNSCYTFEVENCPEGTLEFDAPEFSVIDIQRVV